MSNTARSGLIALFLLPAVLAFQAAEAQQRFTVQSGGRGMENAKHSAQIRQIQVKDGQQDTRLDGHDARLDTVEGDIESLADHAWKELARCGIGSGAGGTGYKITWNPAGSGTWGCIQETDPTVKAFAKTDLPNCGAGQVLRADGNSLSCTTSAGTSGFEVDPYVQDFARNTVYTINACASDEVLTMTNKRLRCIKSQDLNITETDPTVQAFAKAALPECAAGQVLTTGTGTGGVAVLRCVTDTDGGYAELDPSVGTITNNKWCIASGGKIHCNQNPPVLTEADPKIGTLTNARWCRASSGKVICDQSAPVTVTPGGSNGQVQYNSSGSFAGHSGFTYDGAGGVDVTGATDRVISAINTATLGGPIGVYGQSDGTSGRGVSGWAAASSGITYGVYGISTSTSGRGIYGSANATSGTNYGVYGISASTSGRGVYGQATASSGTTYGVYGSASSASGYGVYSNGRMATNSTMTATAYYQSSDRDLKTDIEKIDNPFGLLSVISGKHYIWKDSGKAAYGVIAQDVEKVMPEAVNTSENGVKSVEYSQLIAPLIEAVKQLESRMRKVEAANGCLRTRDNDNGAFRLLNIGAQ